jgi:hypothetical protein
MSSEGKMHEKLEAPSSAGPAAVTVTLTASVWIRPLLVNSAFTGGLKRANRLTHYRC